MPSTQSIGLIDDLVEVGLLSRLGQLARPSLPRQPDEHRRGIMEEWKPSKIRGDHEFYRAIVESLVISLNKVD